MAAVRRLPPAGVGQPNNIPLMSHAKPTGMQSTGSDAWRSAPKPERYYQPFTRCQTATTSSSPSVTK